MPLTTLVLRFDLESAYALKGPGTDAQWAGYIDEAVSAVTDSTGPRSQRR